MNIQNLTKIGNNNPSFSAQISKLKQPNFDLLDSLPESFIKKELELLSEDERKEIQVRLHNVARWQDKYQIIHGKTESVLEHVRDMLELLNYVEYNLPELANQLDLTAVRWMIILHDVGEIGTGDVPLGLQNKKSGIQLKEVEKFFGFSMISKVKNRLLRKRMLGFYKRYEVRDNKPDIEADFVKFLDLIQGMIWGGKNIFPKLKLHQAQKNKILKINTKKTEKINHLGIIAPEILITIFENIYKILSYKGKRDKSALIAKNQLIRLLNEAIKILEKFRDVSEMKEALNMLEIHIGETVINNTPKTHFSKIFS